MNNLLNKRTFVSYKVVLKALLCCTVVWTILTGICDAKTLYVVDSIVITVRTGPGTDYKIIANIKTGDKVEALEQSGDWSKVGFSGDREGWVLSRYLKEKAPNFLVVQKLKSETKANIELIKRLKQENTELKREDKTVKAELAEISTNYADLKEGAEDYLRLKEEHGKAKIKIEELVLSNQQSAIENQVLKDVKKIEWFLAGAGVTFGGWFIGFIMGRSKRKKKSGLTFSLE